MYKRLPVNEVGYERYEVDTNGTVYSTHGIPLKLIVDRHNKNPRVPFHKNGKLQLFLVHRLVAKTFLGTPYGEEGVVRHKDGNIHNNNVNNLYWAQSTKNSDIYVEDAEGSDSVKTPKQVSLGRVEGYTIDTDGNVYDQYGVLKQGTNFRGFKTVIIKINDKWLTMQVDHLVASTIIGGNTEEKPCVFHRNGDIQDNSVDNLEWCSYVKYVMLLKENLGKYQTIVREAPITYNNYDNYTVDTDGIVRNEAGNRLLIKDNKVVLWKCGLQKYYPLDVIVAKTFLTNNRGKDCILYHIDGNISNCSLENLIWLTSDEAGELTKINRRSRWGVPSVTFTSSQNNTPRAYAPINVDIPKKTSKPSEPKVNEPASEVIETSEHKPSVEVPKSFDLREMITSQSVSFVPMIAEDDNGMYLINSIGDMVLLLKGVDTCDTDIDTLIKYILNMVKSGVIICNGYKWETM